MLTYRWILCGARACYGVLRFVMESGALGCEVIVSGKLRAQRAKAMKFEDGYMIKAGNPCRNFIDSAVRHVLLRQGKPHRSPVDPWLSIPRRCDVFLFQISPCCR